MRVVGLFMVLSGFLCSQLGLAKPCDEPLKQLIAKTGWTSPQSEFDNGASYAAVYDAGIGALPWHQALRAHHSALQPSSGLIVEMGGGTALISRKAKLDAPQRNIHVLDISQQMLAHAIEQGVARNHVHVADAADMSINGHKVPEGTVRGVINNNVTYILDGDHVDAAIEEWARGLEDYGVLTYGGPHPWNTQDVRFFGRALDRQMSQQVRLGIIPELVRDTVVGANDRLANTFVTTMTNKAAIERLRKHNLEPFYSGTEYWGLLHLIAARRVPRQRPSPPVSVYFSYPSRSAFPNQEFVVPVTPNRRVLPAQRWLWPALSTP